MEPAVASIKKNRKQAGKRGAGNTLAGVAGRLFADGTGIHE